MEKNQDYNFQKLSGVAIIDEVMNALCLILFCSVLSFFFCSGGCFVIAFGLSCCFVFLSQFHELTTKPPSRTLKGQDSRHGNGTNAGVNAGS